MIPVYIQKEIQKGDDLVELFLENFRELKDKDIVVIAHKVVSKQEGMVISLENVIPSVVAIGIAAQYRKDPRVVEVILSEAQRIVRLYNGVIITQTKHGFVCANSGVDESNVPAGSVCVLPDDPDKSARDFEEKIFQKTGKKIGVIISDTFGRPFRNGQTNCAIGVSGIGAIESYEGKPDMFGRQLRVTAIAQADELCGAAELVMKKTKNCPFAVIRGYDFELSGDGAKSLIRKKDADLFR